MTLSPGTVAPDLDRVTNPQDGLSPCDTDATRLDGSGCSGFASGGLWFGSIAGRRSGSAWLPSWGTSLLLHAVVLVIFATAFYVSGPSPRPADDFDSSIISLANEDLTTLVAADKAGDPFSTLQTDAAPSLATDAVDPSVTAQPKLVGASYRPSLVMPDRSASRSEFGASDLLRSVRTHSEDMTAPFSGRSEANRAALVRREGGTPASERAVPRGPELAEPPPARRRRLEPRHE